MAESRDRFTAARASGATGSACTLSGPYRSTRNARVIVFVLAGTKFPPDSDGVSTTWSVVGDTTVAITPISL
jgi:hypothetical protein